VNTFAEHQGVVHAGGDFSRVCDDGACTTSTATGVNRVARWTGSAWEPLAFGLFSVPVNALASIGGALYAGGDIRRVCLDAACASNSATGVNGIARFDGAAWQPVGFGVYSENGDNINGIVAAGGGLFVGGDFTNLCQNATCSPRGASVPPVARWDPSIAAWLPLGYGVSSWSSIYAVRAMTVQTDTLVVGGQFGVAGERASGFIAAFGPIADAGAQATGVPDPVLAGQIITYTATITNAGPGVATGVVLTATLDPDVTFASAQASQGGCSGTTTVVCTIGSLPACGQATVTIQATAGNNQPFFQTYFALGSAPVDPVAGNDSAIVETDRVTATPTFPPGVPTFTPTATPPPGSTPTETPTPRPTRTPTLTPTATFPPGVPTFTPSPTPTLAPGQTLPSYLGSMPLRAPFE
jgi:uncharacterized repeat protein (TIGR01451 family)